MRCGFDSYLRDVNEYEAAKLSLQALRDMEADIKRMAENIKQFEKAADEINMILNETLVDMGWMTRAMQELGPLPRTWMCSSVRTRVRFMTWLMKNIPPKPPIVLDVTS